MGFRAWRTLGIGFFCAVWAASSFARPSRTMDSPHFRFYYDAKNVYQMNTVQRSAESAYDRLNDALHVVPPQRIPVYLYGDRSEFQRETGVNRTELVLGVATGADQAIRLDASEIFDAPDRVVGHEVAHIFLNNLLGPYAAVLPLWMNEGIAQVIGGADGEAAHNHVTAALLEGGLIPLSKLEHRFPEDNTSGLAYDEAQDAVRTMLKDGGWAKMNVLLGELRSAQSFDAAMQKAYGVDAAGWEKRWSLSTRMRSQFAFWAQVAEWLIPFMMFTALIWGIITVRRHRIKQIQDEEPLPDTQPPAWWKEDQWR